MLDFKLFPFRVFHQLVKGGLLHSTVCAPAPARALAVGFLDPLYADRDYPHAG